MESIQGGKIDFEPAAICDAGHRIRRGPHGQILGPRNLMPNPKDRKRGRWMLAEARDRGQGPARSSSR